MLLNLEYKAEPLIFKVNAKMSYPLEQPIEIASLNQRWFQRTLDPGAIVAAISPKLSPKLREVSNIFETTVTVIFQRQIAPKLSYTSDIYRELERDKR